MKPLIIANLKSHKLEADLLEWLEDVNKFAAGITISVAVAPSFTYLHLLQNFPHLISTSQNVSPFPPGSYTGEVNSEQLSNYEIKMCLVGHSERRKYFKETSNQVSNKIDMLSEEGIIPVICVDKSTFSDQITMLDSNNRNNFIYAYEPSESIGSGNPADPQEIEEVASMIHDLTSPETQVLYGGSVDENNISKYLSIRGISGALVASASLDPKSFIKLLNNGK